MTVKDPHVLAARVATAMDIQFGDRDCVESLPVSIDQCSAESDIDAAVCESIGIPLIYRRLSLSLTGMDRRVGPPCEVIGIAPLLHFLNPTLGMVDERHGVGGAIVVRKDGKPLHVTHMHAFADYGRNIIQSTPPDKKDLRMPIDISACSKKHFLEWYTNWTASATTKARFDVNVPSLYDV